MALRGYPLVRAFYASTTSPNTLYAATEGRGIFRSTDGGRTWETVVLESAEGEALDGNAFLGDGAEPETLYAATSGGIFVLRPGEPRWSLATAQPGGLPPVQVNAKSLAWDASRRLVAALTGEGVWVSADSGATWIAQNSGLIGEALQAQAVIRGPGEALFLGTWGGGIYRLRKDSTTWEPFAAGLPAAATVFALAYVPGEGTLYASISGAGLFRSVQGGDWQPVGLPGSWWALSYHEQAGALYVGSALEQWGGTGGAWRSTDGGRTWQAMALPATHARVTDLIWLDTRTGTLLAATSSSRTFISYNRGQAWQLADAGFPTDKVSQITTLYRDPTDGALHAGTPQGVWRSMDGAQHWEGFGQGLPADTSGSVLDIVAFGSDNRRTLFVGLLGGGIYRRTPGAAVWEPANGGLPLNPPPAVPGFLVDGGELLASVSNSGVHRYVPAEDRWQLISSGPLEPFYVPAFARSGSSGPGQLVTGSAPRSLAVGEDGLYSREGRAPFRRTLPGLYQGLTVDVAHPQVLYAGVLTNTHPIAVPLGQPTAPTFHTAISIDNGDTWRLGGPLADPINVLLTDPTQPNVLYAGTDNGVYRGQVHLPILWREVVAWALLFTLLLLILALLLYACLTLTLPYGVPLPDAVRLMLGHRRALATALAEPPSLSPLEQFILAEAGRQPPWPSEEVAAALDVRDAHASSAQLATALAQLTDQLRFLARDAGGRYRVRVPGLVQLMRSRVARQAQRLAKAVREENAIYLEAREFFRQAGFAVHARGDVLLLQPLGGSGIAVGQVKSGAGGNGVGEPLFARLVTAKRPEASDVNATLQTAFVEYNQQVAGCTAFLVVTNSPDQTAYRRIADLRADPGLQIVLISHTAIHRALAEGGVSMALQTALRRARGELNAGMLTGPVFDPLDFFDRTAPLDRIASTIGGGGVMLLAGPPQVGKSSLAWQATQALSDHLVGYIDVEHAGLADARAPKAVTLLFDVLLQILLRDGARKYPQMEWPFALRDARVADVETFAQALDGLAEALRSQTALPRLVLVVDGLTPAHQTWWSELATMAQARPFVGLLGVQTGRPGMISHGQLLDVLPFDQAGSEIMVNSMATQAGVFLAEGAVDALHQQSGGHPLLLRQLFGAAMAHAQALSQPARPFHPGDVAAAVRQHVSTSQLYGQWWRQWDRTEQQALIDIASEGTTESSQAAVAEALMRWGWVQREGAGYRVASDALLAWLQLFFTGTRS
jgi:hypothetical protein